MLFLTAMWEVFALAGLRAALIYYLVKQLHFSDAHAVELYAISAGGSVALGTVGGLAADRLLGIRRSVLIGAGLMSLGSFALVYPPLLYVGLTLSALGNGLFRSPLAAQVGLLYSEDDPRRDRAFMVYKVGCNLGAFLAPLICGAVGAFYGWNWAFSASGVGMLISSVVFVGGKRWIPSRKVPPTSVAAVPETKEPWSARQALILLGIIWIASVLFFSAYRQVESSVALFVDRDIARTVSVGTWHFEVPAAWFQAVNPLLIFLFGPLLNLLWSRRQERMSVNTGLRRMVIGALLLAVSFGILAATRYLGEITGAGTAAWVLIAIVPFTVAELYFDPIGQSLFSRLALRGYASLFMSVWFVSDLAAYGATAWLGEVWANSQPTRFFTVVSTLAILAATLVLMGDCVAVYFRQSVRSHRSNAGA